MNKLSIKFLLATAALLIFGAVSVMAQDLGQLNGTVKDQNGAVVSGATVKATNSSTGISKTTTTNGDGFYSIQNLNPGGYDIEVTGSGFATQKARATVSVGGATTENIQLGVNAIINVVDVAGDSGGVAEVNTTDQQQSNVITGKQISSLPIIDRNPYSLAATAGNVSTADADGRGAGVAVNGLRSASTDVLLDGTENAAVFTAGIAQTVPQDGVAEFRIITNNFSAEYGRASGGIVNVITKGGGNKLTGSAFYQDRRASFASNSFDNNANSIAKDPFTRKQFGGTVSGPIIKNKLFFLDSLELVRVRSSATIQAYVPTASFINLMAANAKAVFTANTLAATATGGVVAATNAGGVVPVQCLVAAVNVCTYQKVTYTAPTDAGGGVPTNDWNNLARADWNISDNTSANFSYKFFDSKNLPGSRFNSPWAGYDTTISGRSQNFQGSVVHNFSSRFIMDIKGSWSRLQGGTVLGSKPATSPTLYALQNGTATLSGDPVAYPGYIPYNPGFGLDLTEDQKLIDIKPNGTYIVGDHNIRFGGQYVNISDAVNFPAYQNASENLSGTVANASAALMGGTNGCAVGTACTQLFQVALDPQGKFPGGTITRPATSPNFTRTNLYKEFALYVNDQWRIVNRLTLNLGVRYEYFGPQHSKEGLDSNFFLGSGSNIQQRIRNGRLQTTGTNGVWAADKNNWAPRVGFAWDVNGDGKTSIRGGYGLAFERNFGNVTFNVIQNPPYYAVLGDTNVPVNNSNFGNFGIAGPSITLPRTTLRAVDPNIQTAMAHQWGLSFERQIAPNTVVKIEYSGSAGRHLYSIANINRPGSGEFWLGSGATSGVDCPATLTSTNRLNCNYGNVNWRGSDGTSNYKGLTTSLESLDLLHTGLQLVARYTFSSAKDNLSSTFSSGNGGNYILGYMDPFNPMLDYGPAEFDVRHRFIGSAIYPFPFKFTNSAAEHILGGWNLSAIVNIQSGAPFSIYDCGANAFSLCMRMVANGNLAFNGTRVSAGGANFYNFIDLSGVTQAGNTFNDGTSCGCYDNTQPTNMTARNSFRAPSFWNVDASLYKNIHITERYGVQLRADAFNVLNRANTFIVGSSADVDTGFVPAFKDGNRRVQLSARFIF